VGCKHARVVNDDGDPAGLTGISTHRDHHGGRVWHSTNPPALNGTPAWNATAQWCRYGRLAASRKSS
jgi:hypothetical protein